MLWYPFLFLFVDRCTSDCCRTRWELRPQPWGRGASEREENQQGAETQFYLQTTIEHSHLIPYKLCLYAGMWIDPLRDNGGSVSSWLWWWLDQDNIREVFVNVPREDSSYLYSLMSFEFYFSVKASSSAIRNSFHLRKKFMEFLEKNRVQASRVSGSNKESLAEEVGTPKTQLYPSHPMYIN